MLSSIEAVRSYYTSALNERLLYNSITFVLAAVWTEHDQSLSTTITTRMYEHGSSIVLLTHA